MVLNPENTRAFWNRSASLSTRASFSSAPYFFCSPPRLQPSLWGRRFFSLPLCQSVFAASMQILVYRLFIFLLLSSRGTLNRPLVTSLCGRKALMFRVSSPGVSSTLQSRLPPPASHAGAHQPLSYTFRPVLLC